MFRWATRNVRIKVGVRIRNVDHKVYEAGIGRKYYGFAKNVLTAAKQNGATRMV